MINRLIQAQLEQMVANTCKQDSGIKELLHNLYYYITAFYLLALYKKHHTESKISIAKQILKLSYRKHWLYN